MVAALSSLAVGGNGGVGLSQAPISIFFIYGVVATPNICTLCFHTVSTRFPRPELCYKMYIVCELMARYLLESSECGSRVHVLMFIDSWAYRW
jgi:hypothetical protein